MKWATRYFTRFLRTHFHALRMLGPAPTLPPGPAIIYLNHPSWHDPLTCFFLARQFFPGRTHHAPIAAHALRQYNFLGKLGLFPVDAHSRQGLAGFLHTASSLLSHDNATLWITPEGRFTDPRARPTTFRPGLAHLVRKGPAATLLPLALECTFWNQPRPELLLSFGNPLSSTQFHASPTQHLTSTLERHLEAAQDRLAAAAHTRNPALFTTLLQGTQGIHPVYDAWRSLIAKLTGKPFSLDHEA